MKVFILGALILAGCSTATYTRAPATFCGVPKSEAFEKAAGVLTANGFEIRHSSAETGIIQAERTVERYVVKWSGVFTGDSIRQTAAYVSPAYDRLSEVNFSRIKPPVSRWLLPVIDGVQAICRQLEQVGTEKRE